VTNSVFAVRADGTLQPVSVTQNIGKVNLQGIELEAEYVFSKNFSVTANWNYADNEIKSYVYTPGGLRIRGSSDVNGNQLERTPKVSWAVSPVVRGTFNEEYDCSHGSIIAGAAASSLTRPTSHGFLPHIFSTSVQG
jgi:outer membrane receptor for ferrienterochelin and colicin